MIVTPVLPASTPIWVFGVPIVSPVAPLAPRFGVTSRLFSRGPSTDEVSGAGCAAELPSTPVEKLVPEPPTSPATRPKPL